MTDYKQLKYDNTKVQVESAIRDEEGYSIKGCYAKKNEIKDGVLTINTNGGTSLGTFSANQSSNQTITLPNGTVQLLNQSVTFVANTDSSTNTEFPYRASVSVTGVKSSTYAEVVYSEEQATSLNFASFVDTATNVIYIYSRTDAGTVTIPTISIGMDYSDITIDSTPTSGSGNAVSSGGVYDALEDKLTKDASADMTDGALLRWNATGSKAVTNSVTFCRKYSGSATITNADWVSSGDTTYPYKAVIAITGVTANDYPIVSFPSARARSGDFSQECDTGAGTLIVYSKRVIGSDITITYMIIQDVS